MTRQKPGTGWASGLDDSAWGDLALRGRERRLPRGSALFVQGERPGSVAVSLEGRLKIVRVADDGTESLLAVRGPGDLVGELSALDGGPRSATVTALEPAVALVVDAEGFRAWLGAHPGAALALLKMVAGRLRDADSTRAEFAATDVTARLARRLLQLAARYGEPDAGVVRIDLPVTQEDLAGWVGASREAVAKAMRLLRDRHAVTTARRSVAVRDLDALRRLARLCARLHTRDVASSLVPPALPPASCEAWRPGTGPAGEKGARPMTIDQEKLETTLFATVADIAAAASTAAALVGHKAGLYRAMAGAGPMTSDQLAQATGTRERYVREWLNNQAAGGYVEYDPASGTYTLPDERAAILADPDSPVFLAGGLDMIAGIWAAVDRLEEAFRTGEGVGWHEHHPRLFSGTEEFFRPGYRAHLVAEWIPALDGVHERLTAGARVADVGCGRGGTTVQLGEAYPRSTFTGVDYHEASIKAATRAAADAGVADRVSFEVADAAGIPGDGYDLVCYFDALHDMGDPVGAARRAREVLKPDGTVMLVEPNAGDNVEDNLNPFGRIGYAASTFLCTPNSLSQPVALGLGAQAGEARIRDVMTQAGFSRFRRAAENPINFVFEARP